ncbi:putative Receptor like protein 53 [Hibiscus syriacus]|uniref:Receptor like protein 53 n=1 Tax=Hibiscus syriacus TaxID=106335 RepID=A0A6A2W8T6_HIBSY|nr:putative Receptor like protein 53 [Hibiscus syriacus]
MKQKIVIKVSMHSEKCRTKALKIAAATDGVVSVALHCPGKDKLMIVGDGVDAVCLTSSLRKQLCHASLETVEEVKDKKAEEKKDAGKKDEEKKDPKFISSPIICCMPPQHQPEFFTVVTDPHPSPCTIL